MPQPGRLQGRNCLIVGGTGGIGLATARRFLAEGARVAVCGREQQTTTEETCSVLRDAGEERFLAMTVDASDPVQVEGLFVQAVDFFAGRLDILYHLAGISGRRFGDAALHECTVEGWNTVLNINARSLFLTNRAAAKHMLAQAPDDHGVRGTVLNMGSVLGWSPAADYFGTIAYAASKGAIQALTLCAAARYARDGIRFNVIAPALIETPMAVRAVTDPAIRAYLATKQPLAAGPGTAEDCAQAALFLCEPASRFLTGVVLNVDGGWCVSEGQLPMEQAPSHSSSTDTP
jgi:NAD(P)-dependent dehydrogenase (short-subunit alcohol dehydrogenase family)